MTTIQERYHAKVVGVNATVNIDSRQIGGFLAVTAGTITVTNAAAVVILNAFPVAAGQYVPLVMLVGEPSATFTTAGGASGTLLV